MNYFDLAVAKKLAGGSGGGGGSSDFSTATVTLVDNTQSGGNIFIPFVIEGDISLAVGQIATQGGDTRTIQAIMYKEKSSATVTFGSNISVTGNIQDFGEGNYLITGDGTITIS